MKHELKIWPQYFQAVLTGEKTFELRINDRGFQKGDLVILKEWDPEIVVKDDSDSCHPMQAAHSWEEERGYTGRQLDFLIGYVIQVPDSKNYCVFSLLPIIEKQV